MDDQVPGRKRQLEWQEAALAQGFPADYLFYGSPTRVAKMIGQAIQIDLGRAILKAICNAI
jgi:site-specific DNA-cytosine methylase